MGKFHEYRRCCRELEYHGLIRQLGSKTEGEGPPVWRMFVRVGINRTGESEAYVIDEWENTDG